MLVCNGDSIGGYVLYIMDNRLIYEYNNFGDRYTITSETDVPVGKSLLKFEFERTGNCRGNGALYIDDRRVGQTEINTMPFGLSMAYTDVGRDTSSPVSKAYKDKGEFRFSGRMEFVNFELKEIQTDSTQVEIKDGPFRSH